MWEKCEIKEQQSVSGVKKISSDGSYLLIPWLTDTIDLIKIKLNGWLIPISDVVVLKLMLPKLTAPIKISRWNQSIVCTNIITDGTNLD